MRAHSESYDGLRGFAISLVVVHHLGLFERWRVGPEIFFVLSGFLITRNLAGQAGRGATAVLLRFHRRRILRLLPPLLVLLAATVTMLRLTPEFGAEADRDVLATLTYTMNWQQALTPWRSQSLVHLWSLAAEQQFYVLWPPVVLACPRRWLGPALAGIVVGSIAWRFALCGQGADFDRIYFGLDTHADALAAGCLLALARVPARLHPLLRQAGIGCFLLAGVAALVLRATTPVMLSVSLTAMTALAVVIVAAAPLGGPLGRALAVPPLQAVGRMSYSLYLWHFPVIAFCHPHWGHGMKATQIVTLFGVSALAYWLIEKPLLVRLRGRRDVEDRGASGRVGAVQPSPA